MHLWNCDIMTQHNEYYSFQLWSVVTTCVEKRKVRKQDQKKKKKKKYIYILSRTVVWSNVQMYCHEREMNFHYIIIRHVLSFE